MSFEHKFSHYLFPIMNRKVPAYSSLSVKVSMFTVTRGRQLY